MIDRWRCTSACAEKCAGFVLCLLVHFSMEATVFAMEKRLNLMKIFNYVDGSIRSRCITEGESLLASNHLIMCGAKMKSAHKIVVEASCLRSTAVHSDPHRINGTLEKDKEWIIKEFVCSCKAGASGCCKHCVCVMLYCNRFEKCFELYFERLN